MSRYRDQEPLGFLETTAAVCVGILAANLIQLLVVAIMAKAAVDSITKPTTRAPTPTYQRPAVFEPQARRRPQAASQRPLAADERCIDGTRFRRDGSQWVQNGRC